MRKATSADAEAMKHHKQAKDMPNKSHARKLQGLGGGKFDGTEAKPVWLLPRSHKKWKPRPGRTNRFDDRAVDTRQVDISNQPIAKPQWVDERSYVARGNTGLVRVWHEKKWAPKGNIPKGF